MHTVTISYLVTCWLRSAPVCSCQRSKQAQPPPAAKWTGDCSKGFGGALTESPVSSRCFKLSTCGKRTVPAALLPLSSPTPSWFSTFQLGRGLTGSAQWSVHFTLTNASEKTDIWKLLSLWDKRGPSLTSELQSSNSISRLTAEDRSPGASRAVWHSLQTQVRVHKPPTYGRI